MTKSKKLNQSLLELNFCDSELIVQCGQSSPCQGSKEFEPQLLLEELLRESMTNFLTVVSQKSSAKLKDIQTSSSTTTAAFTSKLSTSMQQFDIETWIPPASQ
jgi:hypothetical protein